MSLVTSLYVGASGLDAATDELSVVGDNIANSSTTGFKSARTDFADAMAQQLVGANGQMGLGVSTEAVQKDFSEGGFTTTGLSTDVAIQGNGMLVVKGNQGGVDGTFYTRDGELTVDSNGYLTNIAGLKVQGLQADASGTVTSGLLGDLQVGNASAPAEATNDITIRGNLDQTAAATEGTFTPATAKDSSNFTTTMTVYDSLGNAIQLNIYFCKNDTAGTGTDVTQPGDSGDWTYHVLTDGGNVTQDENAVATTAGTPAEVATGTLDFNSSGALISNTTTLQGFSPKNATSPQQLTFNFGTGTSTGGSGLDGLTQYAADSAVSFVTQEGSSSGSLSSISIGQDGTITGSFTNGQTRTLGQLILADFKAPDQLQRIGSTLYTETPTSGEPTLGTPSTADRGSINAGTLEQSNVDISAQFIRMIAAQRNFEANAKTLTTADQLLSDLIQIKR
jgi:flagellar hook protein FlgE